MDAQAFSIVEFCAAHGFSRAMFYVLKRQGRAPAMMKIGRRSLITAEAAAAWRKWMEAEAVKTSP